MAASPFEGDGARRRWVHKASTWSSLCKVSRRSGFEPRWDDGEEQLCWSNDSSSIHNRSAGSHDCSLGDWRILILSGLDSAEEESEPGGSDALWACGAVLMALGTIYVGQKAVA